MLFTSESVSPGHPDKICDQISDAILDAILTQDKHARVAVEALVKDNNVILAGEVRTDAKVDFEAITRQTIVDIGYYRDDLGFSGHTCRIQNFISDQSPDIARGVDKGDDKQGAGDQGLMFGFACNETPELMPMPIMLAHALMRHHYNLRDSDTLRWLRPDAKSQVTCRYDEHGKINAIDTVVLSTQHDESISHECLKDEVREKIIDYILPLQWITKDTKFHINPTGQFTIGGPAGDAGLTGRKIIVDTYGGMARHGGGAFSGKDPSKVDRSAAYAARYIAKHIVAAGLARRCEVQISYAIGEAEPTSIRIDTGKQWPKKASDQIKEIFDLTPKGIICMLSLLRPIYLPTATFGHFGREEPDFSWEVIDKSKIAQLQSIKTVA